MNKRFLAALLVCTALSGMPAHAQDPARDILATPSMTGGVTDNFTPERRSAPPQDAAAGVSAPAAEAEPQPQRADVSPAPLPAHKPALGVPLDAAAPVTAVPVTPLSDILATAYQTSPTLRAEREVLRQQYENVAQAASNWRPYVYAQGGVAANYADTRPGSDDTFASRDATLGVQQYLYRGGRTLAQVEQQLRLSAAAQAAYDVATQNAMLAVVAAAMDIQRDRATIELREKNLQVLTKQLDAAKNGFEVGELTRTDVAQSQARLSGADADLVAARADYSSSLARYRQYAGLDGETLVLPDVAAPGGMPQTLEGALAQAEAEHPAIRAALEDERAAEKAVDVAQGTLLPEISLEGAATSAWDPSAIIDRSETATLGVRASMPLYEGGLNRSQIRQAKYARYEKRDRTEEAQRDVRQQVTTAWNDYKAALAQIDAYGKQVDAATLARDGVYKEREVGTRTVLDTLDADAELLDAEVGLVRARRDAVVAAYALLAATGQLTGERLGFATAAAENAHLEAARGNILGTATEPRQ